MPALAGASTSAGGGSASARDWILGRLPSLDMMTAPSQRIAMGAVHAQPTDHTAAAAAQLQRSSTPPRSRPYAETNDNTGQPNKRGVEGYHAEDIRVGGGDAHELPYKLHKQSTYV